MIFFFKRFRARTNNNELCDRSRVFHAKSAIYWPQRFRSFRRREAINSVFPCSQYPHVMTCEEGFVLASSPCTHWQRIRSRVFVATNKYPTKLNRRLNSLFGLQNKRHSFIGPLALHYAARPAETLFIWFVFNEIWALKITVIHIFIRRHRWFRCVGRFVFNRS